MTKQSKTLKQQLLAANLNVMEIEEDYITQLYLETMPAYDPTYKYCYSTSNFTIPHELQSVDAWLRAIIKHMAGRRAGHGGAYTDARVVTIINNMSAVAIEKWITYETNKLRKLATPRKKVISI